MSERLTYKSVEVRAVAVPLKRPVIAKVGSFKEWPLILIDLCTHEGIVGRSYLGPYLKNAARYVIPAIRDLAACADRQAGCAARQFSAQSAIASTSSAMKGSR